MEPARNKRDLCSIKINKITIRNLKHIELKNRRQVGKDLTEITELFERFESLHLDFVNKSNTNLGDDVNAEQYDQCEEEVNQMIERCETFLAAEEAVELADSVLRKYEELNDVGKTITGELELLEHELMELKEKSTDNFRADVAQVAIAVASAEKKLELAREKAEYILTNENSPQERKDLLKKMAELEFKTKKTCLRIKSFCQRTQDASRPGSGSSSRAASPERGKPPDDPHEDNIEIQRRTGIAVAGLGLQPRRVVVNPPIIRPPGMSDQESDPSGPRSDPRAMFVENTEDEGQPFRPGSRSASRGSGGLSQTLFKSKRMEFPKFGGSIRSFNTFRRDFMEIVFKDQGYSEDQMSHILRHECLQGTAKSMVHNIYDYHSIWAKLNDVYDNEAEVVQIITKQILQSKHVAEEDWDGFVEFVNLIERAHYDLNALANSRALSNPMTVAAILERCPEWAQKELVKAMSESKVSSEAEFEFIRLRLEDLRKQARKLSSLSQKKNFKSKPGGRGVVNTVDSNTASQSGLKSGSEVVNAVTGGSTWKASSNEDFKCSVPGCKYNKRHNFSGCHVFKKMSLNEKGKWVKDSNLCVLCFSKHHKVNDCERKTTWKPCDVNNCGKWHSRTLHGAKVQGLVLAIPTAASEGSSPGVLLLVQPVPVLGGAELVTLWDSGSTTALISFSAAEKCGLSGVPCQFELHGVGENKNVFETKLYTVPAVDKCGQTHYIQAYGIEKITSTSIKDELIRAVSTFQGVDQGDIKIPEGEVELLVGMNHVRLQPVMVEVQGDLALFSSKFGTGKLLGGVSGQSGGAHVLHQAQLVANQESKSVKMDFLSAEAFGIDIPRRCNNCKNCKECNFKSHQITFKELMELNVIEKGLVYDDSKQRWTSSYPFEQDPSCLQDNYSQAMACMMSTERRLAKRDLLAAYDEQFKETVERGVFQEVTKEELENYAGPVNYISIVEAFKQGPHCTTPLRLCMNSSLKFRGISLNDILMKGPSALTDIMNISLGFRSYPVAIVKDISKFYNSVASVDRDQHLRRVLHRPGGQGEVKIYKTTTVNFGDKPAGCVAQSALRGTAVNFKQVDPEASRKIIEDSYVDDTITGAEDLEKAVVLSRNMDKIALMGGFKYKETVMSGDPSSDAEPRKVLGLGWASQEDVVYVSTNVNVSEKKKGVKTDPDILLEDLVAKFPKIITKRIVWRIVLAQYDMLGLICVFTIKLKLIMKALVGEDEGKMKWDDPISGKLRDDLLGVLQELLLLRKVRFPRCVAPGGITLDQRFELLILADGSQSAFCALIYLRQELAAGTFACRLVAGKTRVAPTRKISVPRMELMGAVTAVRLAETVSRGLRLEITRKYFFTDSSAVLGMIRSPSGSFNEFVGTRVGEIRSKCDAERDWYWIPTDLNLADMGTRPTVKPAEMEVGTDYQDGMPWMRTPKETWPVTQTPGKAPEEEMIAAAKVNLAISKTEDFLPIGSFSSLTRVTNCLSLVAKFCQNLRGKSRGRDVPRDLQLKAEYWLIYRAQVDLRPAFAKGELATLRPREMEFQSFTSLRLIVTSGRLGEHLAVGYDKPYLPLLAAKAELATLFIRRAHEVDHAGVDRTLQRSRTDVWVIQGRRVAKKVVGNCFTCKVRNKTLQKQRMAPLHESRLPPAPVFDSTAIDLFGPISVKDFVKKRTSRDCWGVIFVCTVTSAIHLEVTEDYSADCFLLTFKKFINLRGTPRRVQSDPGSQLVAAAGVVKQWDCSRIQQWAQQRHIEWNIVPTAAQHFNGCAEAMIKVTKRQLTELMRNKDVSRGELDTLFSDVMVMVNSRPLMCRAGSDPLSGGPITPMHLLLGRATVEVPDIVYQTITSITGRLRFMEALKKEFWDKWFVQVFPNLVPTYRWKKQYRNVQEGDVVLMMNESKVSTSYRLALVKTAVPDKDGLVRKLTLQYKNVDGGAKYRRGGYPFSETERAIHSVVVIKPVDWSEEDVEAAIGQAMVEI